MAIGYVRLRASTEYAVMSVAASKCLAAMEIPFAINGDGIVTEYETSSPYFRVVIEPNRIPSVHNFPTRSIAAPKGSTIEIRFDVDATKEEIEIANDTARRFVRLLIEELPTKPWTGIGGLLKSDEKKWRSYAEDC